MIDVIQGYDRGSKQIVVKSMIEVQSQTCDNKAYDRGPQINRPNQSLDCWKPLDNAILR